MGRLISRIAYSLIPLTLAAVVMACAVKARAPQLATLPPVDAPMWVGTNMYGGPDTAETAAVVAAWKHPILRVHVESPAQVAGVRGMTPAHVMIVFLFERPDLALVGIVAPTLATMTNVAAELVNEPNLPPVDMIGAAFRAHVSEGYGILRTAGFTGPILSGGISNVQPETLRAFIDPRWPADLIVSVHIYGDYGTQHYATPDDMHHAVQNAAGARRVAVTEFGYHGDNDAIAALTRDDLDDCKGQHRWACISYQWTDGPDTPGAPVDVLNHFGMRRVDGTDKSQAHVIAEFE